MLFVKYLSDTHRERLAGLKSQFQFKGNEERIKRSLSRERFIVSRASTLDDLYNKRTASEVGAEINKALAKLEEDNLAN